MTKKLRQLANHQSFSKMIVARLKSPPQIPRNTMDIVENLHASHFFHQKIVLQISKVYFIMALNVSLSIYSFIHLSIYRFIHLSIYPSIYLSIYLSIHLSIYPSIHLSMYLSIYLIHHSHNFLDTAIPGRPHCPTTLRRCMRWANARAHPGPTSPGTVLMWKFPRLNPGFVEGMFNIRGKGWYLFDGDVVQTSGQIVITH